MYCFRPIIIVVAALVVLISILLIKHRKKLLALIHISVFMAKLRYTVAFHVAIGKFIRLVETVFLATGKFILARIDTYYKELTEKAEKAIETWKQQSLIAADVLSKTRQEG